MKWKSVCMLGVAVVAASCAPDQELATGPETSNPTTPSFVIYSPGTVTVQPTSTANVFTDSWLAGPDRTIPAGGSGAATIGAFPASQVLGAGSLRMVTASTLDLGWEAAAPSAPAVPAATPLANITALSYSTYTPSGQAGIAVQAVALQFTIDYDLTDSYEGFQGRLVYEPYHCNTVAQDVWLTWNTLASPSAGCWWQTAVPSNSARAPYIANIQQVVALPCPMTNPCTWTEVQSAYPNAGFHRTNTARGVILKVGSTWKGTFYTDAVVVGVSGGSTTYDFEPATQCTTTCYVNAASGDDALGGDTPATAKKTIQAAVTQVSASGTVIVAAGSYAENVVINKDDLTLEGAGIGTSVLQGSSCTTTGIAITGNRTGITIRDLTVTGYQYGITTGNIGNTVSNITLEDLSSSDNCVHGIWFQAGNSTNIAFTRVQASRNNAAGGQAGRGLWMINGTKSTISITDGVYSDNGLVGIDLSDGNVTGAVISGNTVSGNRDAGIGVLGAGGALATLIANNIVTNNGRYGIEIKMPGGTGAPSGPGSVVVTGNTVTRTTAAADARDYGGIVVIQRLSGFASVDALLPAGQPKGVFITLNQVSGFHRKPSGSTGDGFGIVVEGTNHTVTKNSVSDNDIGIQIQDGNTANVQGTPYFDRGNATPSSALINRNSITANSDLDIRNVGAPATDATCNWYGSAGGPMAAKLSGSLTTAPWLISSDLDAACPPPDTEAPVVSNVSVTPNPAPYTTASYTLTATGTDNVAVTSASYTIDGGLPVAFTFSAGSPVSLSATFGPLPVGVYDICVTAKDAATNTSNTECTTLTVSDPTPPVVSNVSVTPNPAPYTTASYTLTATGTDNVAVMSASYTIDGGLPVLFTTFSPGSPVSLSATFGPLPVGVYDICVTAKDAAPNTSNTECTMLAVYDPTAGFVTGGGWFMSPAGAYVADIGLTGRASFGFVSKYLRGRTIPTGNTEFQFQAGGLSFSSTAYEWLVVNQAGMNAQFKGTGTLNGVAGYKFMVWAKDGSPDTFRIQITDGAGAVVYDNGEFGTTLGGGNIMIHIPRR